MKPLKLIIQIPCYNEEKDLPTTLAHLPRTIAGVAVVEWLVIDDGSADNTVSVAQQHGVDHIVRHTSNKGLAAAFQTGLDACLKLGADIIVNTDADNQYPGEYIPALIEPIVQGKADMVIADRQVDKIPHFSPIKKRLQHFGSSVVRYVSGTDVPDAPSGFRALSRETALRVNVMTGYTYTLETIIQAGKRNLTVTHIPIQVNPKTRESRLIRNIPDYVRRSATTILRLFVLYEPLRIFTWIAVPFLVVGVGLWLRFGVLWLMGESERGANIQSVVVGAAALIIALLIYMMGIIGDLIAINRRLQEETLYYVKRVSLSTEMSERTAPNAQTNDDEETA
jgi:glycosyltransferase involved in cell wall biosynthesis